MGPIKTTKQVITQPFKPGTHRGVDLRCVNKIYKNLPVVVTEACLVRRQGTDGYGNNYLVVEPVVSMHGYKELKYIHITPTNFQVGQILEEGDIIGKCMIGGNSNSLHLHFETWTAAPLKPVYPLEYFRLLKIPYKFK